MALFKHWSGCCGLSLEDKNRGRGCQSSAPLATWTPKSQRPPLGKGCQLGKVLVHPEHKAVLASCGWGPRKSWLPLQPIPTDARFALVWAPCCVPPQDHLRACQKTSQNERLLGGGLGSFFQRVQPKLLRMFWNSHLLHLHQPQRRDVTSP